MNRALRALPANGLAERLTASAIDQAFVSLRNSLLLLAIAASSGVAAFGTFAVGYAFVSFALAIARAYVGVPLTIDLPKTEPAASRTFVGHATTLALGAALFPFTLLLVAAWLFSAHAGMLVALGIVTPVLILQDTFRYVAAASGHPGPALLADTCWLVVAGGVLVLGVVHEPRPEALVTLWGVGGLVALTLGWWAAGRPSPLVGGLGTVMAKDRRRTRLGAEAAITAATSLLAVNGIALFAGRDVVGEVRAATTLFGLMNVVLMFLSFGLGPEMVRMPTRSRVLAASWAAALTVVVAVVWGTVLLANPFDVAGQLLGASWEGARPLIPYLVCEGAGLCLWMSFGTLLRVSALTWTTLRISAAYAVASVVGILAASATVGTSVAVVTVMAVFGAIVGCVSVLAVVRAGHQVSTAR